MGDAYQPTCLYSCSSIMIWLSLYAANEQRSNQVCTLRSLNLLVFEDSDICKTSLITEGGCDIRAAVQEVPARSDNRNA